MANEDNLQPVRSEEEARALGRKGGIASGKARREKKLLKDQLEVLLSLPNKDSKLQKKMKALGLEDEDTDNQMALVIAMWEKAKKGNVKAAEFIRDTLGEKMPEKVEVNASIGEVANEIESYVDSRQT